MLIKIVGFILNGIEEVKLLDLPCPMPIIRIKKYLVECPGVRKFNVSVNDQGALKDIPAFCQQQKLHCCLLEDGEVIRFQISR